MNVPVMGTSLERNNYCHVVVLNSSHKIISILLVSGEPKNLQRRYPQVVLDSEWAYGG